jgi:hypothetical protein
MTIPHLHQYTVAANNHFLAKNLLRANKRSRWSDSHHYMMGMSGLALLYTGGYSTVRFWELLKAGKFDVVISDIVTKEIENCDDEKKKILTSYLATITYELFILDERSIRIGEDD